MFSTLSSFLRSDHFLKLKAMVQSEPQLLSEYLKELMKSNPELFLFIHENEKLFTTHLTSSEIEIEPSQEDDEEIVLETV